MPRHALLSEVSTAGKTGSYNDLTDKPAVTTIPDATTSSKGVIQLAGDLAGTASLPTVPGLTTKAPIASPAFTGIPTAPTATAGTNNTQLATTAYVDAAAALVEASDVDSFNGRTGTVVPLTGDYTASQVGALGATDTAGGDLTGNYPNPILASVTTATTTGSASSTSVLTKDVKGRVTSAVDTPIAIAESQVTNLVSDLSGKALDANVVHLAGTETITGTKTLTATTTTKGLVPDTDISSDLGSSITNRYRIGYVQRLMMNTGAYFESTANNTIYTSCATNFAGVVSSDIGVRVGPGISTGTSPLSGYLNSFVATSAAVNLGIKAFTSGTNDLTRWLNSGGTTIAKIDSNGTMTANGLAVPSITRTAAYTMTLTDDTTIANPAAPITITLPTPASAFSSNYSRRFTVKNISAFAVTVSGNGGNIDGSATYSLPTQYKYLTVTSDGTNWFILGNN